MRPSSAFSLYRCDRSGQREGLHMSAIPTAVSPSIPETEDERILRQVNERTFDADKRPPHLRPIFTVLPVS